MTPVKASGRSRTVRTIRLILKDRGLATPLIVLLVQLVLLQAGGSALASGAMAAANDPASWCLGGGGSDEAPAGLPCPCAFLCAAQAAAGHVVVPAGDAVLVLVTMEMAARSGPVLVDPGLPKRPPPRPNLTRGPPTA